VDGPYDICCTLNGAWGGWLPYAPGASPSFSLAGFNYLILKLKPTVANQTWLCRAYTAGDVPTTPAPVSLSPYGPAPVVGVWGSYRVPLTALNAVGISIEKFAVQDDTGLSTNVWYVDDVGFSP
jgi:hypothetical protein